MTYFHTGIRTIIGAKAFHCPVRDGKEWYHLAVVIRHNWCSALNLIQGRIIHRVLYISIILIAFNIQVHFINELAGITNILDSKTSCKASVAIKIIGSSLTSN
jgi:hypothetical protein